MTTRYPNKEAALIAGLYYAGSQQSVHGLETIGFREIKAGMNFYALQAEIYEITNEDGELVWLGLTEDRGGYNLWLITDKFARRT